MSETSNLLTRTETRRVEALSRLDAADQARLGQFFTPHLAANLIASMPIIPAKGKLRILDPGAGSGSLAAALIARILAERPDLDVSLVAVEVDEAVAAFLADTLSDIETAAKASGTSVTTNLVVGDYIQIAESLGGDFDIVIMNPPYAKIAADSPYRALMMDRGVLAPNLYAAFMALALMNLKLGGQLVAITPRSFTNGTYFSQFRGWLLDRLALDRIHVFASRSTVFSDTGVLQENIILSGSVGGAPNVVALSTSTGHDDEVLTISVAASDIVRSDDPNRFIRIPSAEGDKVTVDLMSALPADLAALGVKVSTGRVVDFRSRDNLITEQSDDCYPMVYPASFKHGAIVHPHAAGKAQWFRPLNDKDVRMLVPSGVYVLIKRFSAKEERRRLVAGVWSPEENGDSAIAFDNKTNFLHIGGAGLDKELALGFSFWLNSTVVDDYFRTFSGHTQVNAGDLRSMRFPDLETLRALGRGKTYELPAQDEIDDVVNQIVFEKASVAA